MHFLRLDLLPNLHVLEKQGRRGDFRNVRLSQGQTVYWYPRPHPYTVLARQTMKFSQKFSDESAQRQSMTLTDSSCHHEIGWDESVLAGSFLWRQLEVVELRLFYM